MRLGVPTLAGRATGSPSAACARDLDGGAGWIAASPLRAREVVQRVLALPGELLAHRALLASLVRRDLAARWSGTLLGRLWPLVQPLALFGVYLAFAQVLGLRASGVGTADFAGYVLVGVLVWTSVAEALTRAAHSVGAHAELVRKVAFPAAVLPLCSVLAGELLLAAGVAAFVGVRAAFGGEAHGMASAWLLVPVLALQTALLSGLGLALAASQVLIRDTAQILGLALTLGMFATPVFWVADANALPALEPYLGWLAWNPFQHLLALWRAALGADLAGPALAHSLGALAAASLAASLAGAALFEAARERFADEV